MNTDQVIIEKFIDLHPMEAARILERLEYVEVAEFLRQITADLAANVIAKMNSYKASKFLEKLEIKEIVAIMNKLDLLNTELLLRQFDVKFRNKLLDNMPSEVSAKIRQKLKFSSDSVGSLMNMKVFSLPVNISIKEAVQLIKAETELPSSMVFVIDKQGKLEGVVTYKDLFTASETLKISSILIKKVPVFFADDPVGSANSELVWLEFKTIPVVNRSGILIGMLQHEDIKKTGRFYGQEFNRQIIETGIALGELYRIGLTGLLQSTGKIE